MSTLTDKGRELFDQTPVSYPIKFERPVPLHIKIQQQILSVMNDMRSSQDFDTPEDADDFDLDDDPDIWSSPYEGDFDHINLDDFVKKASGRNADQNPHDEPDEKTTSEVSNTDADGKA